MTDQINLQVKAGMRSNPYPPEVGSQCRLTPKIVTKITAMPNAGKLLTKILTGMTTLSKPFLKYAARAPNVFPISQPTMIAGNCRAMVHKMDTLMTSFTDRGYWLIE